MGSHVVMPDAESCDCLSEWHLVYTQTASYRPEKNRASDNYAPGI